MFQQKSPTSPTSSTSPQNKESPTSSLGPHPSSPELSPLFLSSNSPSSKKIPENELYIKNKSLRYLDDLIESFPFSNYHLYTLLVCSFCAMTSSYQITHYFFCKNLVMRKYNWTNNDYSLIFILQNIIGSLGAFISVTTTTFDWDIKSNTIISLISLVTLIMCLYFNEGPFFIIVLLIFNYCQGFIYNITYNFLVEEIKIKYRELAFLLCYSTKLMGNALFGLIEYIIFDIYHSNDPIISLIGLIFIQFLLFLSLYFFTDSPRLLYYNSNYEGLYNYIEYIHGKHIKPYKRQILKRMIYTKRELEDIFGKQKYVDFVLHFKELWEGPYLTLSLKSIIFIFLCNFLMSNLKDSYSFFLKDNSKYLFIIEVDNGPHYKICIYYLYAFIGLFILILCKYLFNIKRRFYSIISLLGCLMSLIFIFLMPKYFIYFLWSFETFANFYYACTYMYFGSFITTKLRNSMTSLLYITNSISYIFQSVLLNSISEYNLFGYINIATTVILFFAEILLIKEDTQDLMAQQMEVKLLRWSLYDTRNKQKEMYHESQA